jgi:hypothetical protein
MLSAKVHFEEFDSSSQMQACASLRQAALNEALTSLVESMDIVKV